MNPTTNTEALQSGPRFLNTIADSSEGRANPSGEPGAVADVAAIARALTKAQRYWVKEGSAHGDISMRMVRTMLSKGLWHIHVDSPNGRYGVAVNTPLGLAVRQHLVEQEGR